MTLVGQAPAKGSPSVQYVFVERTIIREIDVFSRLVIALLR